MEQTASTIEMDHAGFESLVDQIADKKSSGPVNTDIRQKEVKEVKKEPTSSKKYVFRKGDQVYELDEDFEFEMMADKRPMRLTLRELKDRAAGDVAVKNRMHALAEEKKKVQSTFKEFAALAKKDPLGALEYIANRANEADSEFEYNQYIQQLAEQAENLGKMDPKDRKALELEKKLQKAEENLSHKQRQQAVVQRKHELLTDYPEIGDSEFGQMVDAVLGDEELLDGVEDEHGVMNKVEELIQETLTQRDIMSVIQEINPAHMNDNQLIFSISDQLRQNPDFDEEDVRDIISSLIGQPKPSQMSERDKHVRILSQKQRRSMPVQAMKEQNASPYELLEQQLLERKAEISKTPLYKR